MSLPTDFVASATALECYALCARRFQYRYLDHVPTAGLEPGVARRTQRGDIFHRLVVWDSLGLETATILEAADDPEIGELWAAFKVFHSTMKGNGAVLQHDRTLTARCGSHPVQAKLDALSITDSGDVTIFDWKTSARPDRARLIDSAQSKVYPFVVRETMRNCEPEQIRLVYWFAADPDNPLQIDFDAGKLDDASNWLADLLAVIAADSHFRMTEDRTVCSSCEYLAHCGVRPADGGPRDMDEDYYQFPDAEDDVSVGDVVWPHS